MMPATTTTLVVEQGADFSHGWLVTVDGDLVDETWVARGQVRSDVRSDVVLHELEPTVNSDGSVVVGIGADVSTGWSWRSAVYDIEIVNADESLTLRVAEGSIRVRPEVTR